MQLRVARAAENSTMTILYFFFLACACKSKKLRVKIVNVLKSGFQFSKLV